MYSYLGLSEYLKNVRGCTYKFFRFDTSIPAIERSTINSLGQWYTRSTAVQWYRKLSAVRVHSVKRLPAMYIYCLTAKEPPELCENTLGLFGIAWARGWKQGFLYPASQFPFMTLLFSLIQNPNIYLLTLFALISSSRTAYAVKTVHIYIPCALDHSVLFFFYRYVSWMVK